MANPVVSIVMPVYGVEKYLENTVNCVLEQTFSDFELILVDDKSPDSCPQICDMFAQKDPRVKVLHLEQNGGLSNARNSGLEVAKGEYILFLDSDDLFDKKLLELTVASMRENPAQVVVFGLIEQYYNDKNENYDSCPVTYKDLVLNTPEGIHQNVIQLEQLGLYGYAWNKMYDLNYLRSVDLKFKTVTLVEDILFNIEYFSNITACNILSDTLYYYRKNNSSSLTGKFLPTYYDNIMLRIKAIYEQYKTWDMLTDEVLGIIANRYSRYFFSALQRNCDKRMNMNGKKRKEFFNKELETDLYKYLSPYMGGGGLSGIMAKCFKGKNRFACLTISRVIYLVKTYCPKLFEKIN